MAFINEDFLLDNTAGAELYHRHAAGQPIIDYHNHLNPKLIADDYQFSSVSELWLGGDHYKWRALRANGVAEKYITGEATDEEKFRKWAETVPYTMRNPLYHWTHLELKRYFGIDTILNDRSCASIYAECNARLKEKEFSTRGLLKRMNVEVLCTTDDPADSLEHHRQIAAEGISIKVLPTWRPDKVMAVDDAGAYREYILKLGKAADWEIVKFSDLIIALKRRLQFFASVGCRLSDHGLTAFHAADFTEHELSVIFDKVMGGKSLQALEIETFKSGVLYYLAEMNHEAGWTQQFHIGAIRNNSSRLYRQLGADIGCDSIADTEIAGQMSKFFNRLDAAGKLTQTILYNLNPKDTETMVAMAYNFNDGSVAGKMQYGAAWWFLDQMDGMTKQLNALSSLGLLSQFVGMLTDSRSFVSFPRHEYFRRLLCNMLGQDIEKGLLPREETPFIGQLVENICYRNAVRYFKF